MSIGLFPKIEDIKEFNSMSLNGGLPLYGGVIGKSGLPTAIYKVIKHPKEEKFALEPILARWELPPKLYGNIVNDATRVWNRFATTYNRGGGSEGMIATGDSGAGKALHLDTPIRVVNGWKPMRDIAVGDTVIGDDGYPCKVTATYDHTNVYMFKITMEDGRETRPCADHLWKVYSSNNINEVEVINTKNIYDRMINGEVFYIPTCEPVFNTTSSISNDHISIRKLVDSIMSENIPTISSLYLEASIEDRKLIINTLLSKFTNEGNTYVHSFSCTSKTLAEKCVYLARSMGYYANVITTDGKYKVTIKKTDRLKITKLELIGIDNAKCITVNNNSHLYVCEDFIVTHNTETSKVLCNIALDNNMPVVEVTGIKCTIELIDFLSGLNNVVLFMDEFGKNFGNLQEQMLTALSDVYRTNKLFIISENETYLINKFILNSPSRVRYHYRFKKIDKVVMDEYCEDMGVSEKFLLELNEKYDKSPIFSFNHLKALVEEHIAYPEDSLDSLIKVLNVSILDVTNVFKVTKVYDPVSKAEIPYNPGSISVDGFNRGGLLYLRLTTPTSDGLTNIKFSKNDIMTSYDNGDKVLINCAGLIITLEITKDIGGDSRW